ncbi:hypothetical protein G7Y89_g5251 [Cudoniella acicularis]|uniref:Transmembrane protein n=1 Tax=Cudoniella acicularis TaxID=354080 RepID=A0A8H4RNM8_9HELO|nr:hypothetical protein G7Y89_g5251 [Cudoniella acicularis]
MRPTLIALLAAATAVSASSVVLTTASSTVYNPIVARATTTAATTASSPAACSTVTTSSTTTCFTDGTCSSTNVVLSVCAATNVCTTDAGGNNICMFRVDTLTTSGLIVTIAFGVGLVATIIALVTVSCLDGAKAKREKREAAAKLGGKIRPMDDIEPKPYKIGGGGDGEQPLGPPSGPRSQPPAGAPEDYFDQEGSGSNSVTPGSGVPQIQLHQGLGALGQDQEHDQHWSNDYAARSR